MSTNNDNSASNRGALQSIEIQEQSIEIAKIAEESPGIEIPLNVRNVTIDEEPALAEASFIEENVPIEPDPTDRTVNDANGGDSAEPNIDDELLNPGAICHPHNYQPDIANHDSSVDGCWRQLANSIAERKMPILIGCCSTFSVLVVVCIYVAWFLLFGNYASPPQPKPLQVAIDDFQTNKFRADLINASWHDDSLLRQGTDGRIYIFNITDGSETIVRSDFVDIAFSKTQSISADGHFVLVGDIHFPYADIWSIYHILSIDPDNFTAYPITEGGEITVQYATFGTRKSQLATVANNDVLYKSNADRPETALTNTGRSSRNERFTVYNGICPPSYERDIFGHRHALWFAPNGQHLAVIEFTVPGPEDHRYPAVNSTLPGVRLLVFDLSAKRLLNTGVAMPRPKSLDYEPNSILVAVNWALPYDRLLSSSQRLVSAWQNRVQNQLCVQVCSLDGSCTQLVRQENLHGWLLAPRPILLDDFMHKRLYLIEMHNGFATIANYTVSTKLSAPVVAELEENVQQLLHWQIHANCIFYLANRRDRPHERQLFVIDNNFRTPSQCLTCDLFANEEYTYFAASFGPVGMLILLESLGPALPRTDVYQWRHKGSQLELLHKHTLNENQELRARLAQLPAPLLLEHRKVSLGENRTARVQLTYPAICGRNNTMAAVSCPMLVRPYNGPGTFVGTAEWRFDWEEFVALNQSAVVARVDVAGSARMGEDNLQAVYGQLGWTEAADLLSVVRALRNDTAIRVDWDAIGVWGEHYAGLVAGMALAMDRSELLTCGAAVAPMAELQFYSQLFVERYMNRVDEHMFGYINSSLVQRAKDIGDHALLLVDGMDRADWLMSKAMGMALEESDIRFEKARYNVMRPKSIRNPIADYRLPHIELKRYFERCLSGICTKF